jgi:hypothetical protein
MPVAVLIPWSVIERSVLIREPSLAGAHAFVTASVESDGVLMTYHEPGSIVILKDAPRLAAAGTAEGDRT